jgi:malate dehydrogenase (oxaloacetate-decarboxylating)(NADP+)
MRQLYPFCRLGGPANILVMPGLNSANITAKLLPHLGGGTVVGPLLMGLSHPVQIVNIGATVSDLVNLAALSAHDAIR